ncbi:hypothetical protein [Candidatus Formimonas warabiya]|uniref:Uncharacterized protein n=1 Tax=Formimonas warabiya TaxID=1761012 RepID=A0A3G1KSJ2_FORW1|nr:hypothetical protein [Candidatus Formimonas warabiya]ATW25397.1 hypothetical protein DCMF_11995 [Candidatus Formimonas warabiya]
MAKKTEAYKKTEKWWLGLMILFYALYNLPGVPPYGTPHGTIIHAVFTVLPLWIISYVGMIMVHRQRRLKENVNALEKDPMDEEGKEGSKCSL